MCVKIRGGCEPHYRITRMCKIYIVGGKQRKCQTHKINLLCAQPRSRYRDIYFLRGVLPSTLLRRGAIIARRFIAVPRLFSGVKHPKISVASKLLFEICALNTFAIAFANNDRSTDPMSNPLRNREILFQKPSSAPYAHLELLSTLF